ncbi:alpha/beta fold hydrolase [Cryobacterium sp. PAMC25264]|uniref:alpha/beta fold hydrolase n=1 Tax=Cryobacterium sp. PAMC25264 TaxID=2861288 RepID=UPI001C625612|nr:alpha/beta hydrolase [Cryobacterium sp. PAMC25264]QYF72458.1 alpha/beta hydrolase [Cryobacterium sp. PAMC25264]
MPPSEGEGPAPTGWFRRRRAPRLNIHSDTGSGPVVILVHGIASTAVTFRKVVPLLAPNHRVITVDILGHGASPKPAGCEYTLDDHVAALAATIQHLRLRQPFVLVGHSLGSLIATRYASERRWFSPSGSRVSRLVLVGPPIYLSPTDIGDPWVRARVTAYLRAYEFLRANKDFTLANAAVLARLLPKGILELTAENWTPFVKSLEHCIESQTMVSDIASLHVPVDLIYGALDAFVAPGSLRVVERMRHVTTHRVEANDHIVRSRIAKVLVRVIDGAPGPVTGTSGGPTPAEVSG